MMKPSLAILSTHLDGESYTMRKVSRHNPQLMMYLYHCVLQCVLAVMGEIVAKVLSREDLDEAGTYYHMTSLICWEIFNSQFCRER